MSVSVAALLMGIGIGLAVAAPIGPMGVLCIQRTLSLGFQAGFATGLGAATVHLLFGLFAATGLSVGTRSLIASPIFSLTSAGFLFWFAARMVTRSVELDGEPAACVSIFSLYGSALALSASNPLTVVLFLAAFPASAPHAALIDGPSLALGVFVGSLGWWILLASSIAVVRHRLNRTLLAWSNRVSGCFLVALGSISVASALGLQLR